MNYISYCLLLLCFLILVLLAAAFDGLTETLLHHYSQFSDVFPTADPYFWNPALSWQNKGSGLLNRTVLAFGSDGYHLTRFVSRVLLALGLLGLGYLAPAAIPVTRRFIYYSLFACFGIIGFWLLGFYLVYGLLF